MREGADFVAIDVETACFEDSSICQIGIALFQNSQLIMCERRYINPQTRFLPFNTYLHGIVREDIADAPTWKEFYPELRRRIAGQTVVSHTFFDRTALFQACSKHGCAMFSYVRWIDTCAIARRTWPRLASHALPSLARHFEIEYRAHDAAEDARVSGLIFLLSQRAEAEVAV